MPKERKGGRERRRVKGEVVLMPLFSSLSRKLQTTGTDSVFDGTGISTSLFILQPGDVVQPCYRPQKTNKTKGIHIPICPGSQESHSPESSPWTLSPT